MEKLSHALDVHAQRVLKCNFILIYDFTIIETGRFNVFFVVKGQMMLIIRPKMKRNESLECDDLAKSSFQNLHAPVLINNIKLEMIIDTGSPVTLITENIITSLRVVLSDLSTVESTLSAADGNKMSIKVQIKVNIKIGKAEYKQDAIATKLRKLKGIAGMDFLQNHKFHVSRNCQKRN